MDVVLELLQKYILKNEIFTKNIQQHFILFNVTKYLEFRQDSHLPIYLSV